MSDKPEEKKYYAKVKSPLLQLIVSNRLGALFVHWVFQGLLYMDPTERWFKLVIDFILLAIISVVLAVWLPLHLALPIGVIVAHTLNFAFNGQIYGVLKHFGAVDNSQEEFYAEVDRLRTRVAQESCIEFAAIYGSLARDKWSPSSDIDLRVVRSPGLRSAFRVCWFAVQERARAFRIGFPLDMFVLDSYRGLERMAEKNSPIVLVNRNSMVKETD